MVARVNGGPEAGVWFSKDVRFLTVDVTGMTAVTDLAATRDIDGVLAGVNSSLEMVLEAIATRGTIIGLSVATETVIHVMVDYAQAYDDADVVTEVQDAINALDAPDFPALSAADITVNLGFTGAALTP
jgi:hypothetical protein